MTNYENYISTYVERDIRSIKNIENILTFKKFMQLCALRIGSTLNYTDLANSCGITVQTVKSWLSLLETSFILFLLPPYFRNLGKRIIKSPKLYFYDVGLAATIMGISKETIIRQREIHGALFENMIIVDLIKNLHANNIRSTLTFYRDTNQNEIDLIVEHASKTVPIEIKSTETINSKFFQTPLWFQEQINAQEKPVIVYGGDQLQKRSKASVFPWYDVAKLINLF